MILYILPFLIATTTSINEHTLTREPITYHDPWFSHDKFLHFSVSAGLTGFSYYASIDYLDIDSNHAGKYSVSLTALVGIGKELYDKKKKNSFSWKDLIWDGAGIVVGYLVFCRY